MATTKTGPRSGIPSRFGYPGVGSSSAAKTSNTSSANGGLASNHTGKSQLAFNPNRKPIARSENNDMSQQPVRHNGLADHVPIKGDVYIKLPNSTPNSRLSSPINTPGVSGLPTPKDKIAGGSKLQYSSPLNDMAKRREQSASPKTVVCDQEPMSDLPGHLGSLALADKKRHSSDSSANRYKVKQTIPSPLRESNKPDSNHQSAATKPRRGNSPHSALMRHDNFKSDSPIPTSGKMENRQVLKEPSEKHNRLSSGSSGSDDAVVPSHSTAFQKLPNRAESLKAPSNQKITGIPRAFSPPPKATTDEVDCSKSKIKPQHHVLPMSSNLQMKPDNNATHSGRSLLPRSNPNQTSVLPHGRATSPPHVKPNMLPRVIKMKNSNLRQPEDSHDSRKADSPVSEHHKFVAAVNGDSHDKPSYQFRRGSLSTSTSQTKPENMVMYGRSTSIPNDILPPPALVKTNLLEEANDTDSYISETSSESTAATVVLGKKSSIADLSSLDSSSPSSVSQSSVTSKFPVLSPPLNPEEFPAYFSHDTKVLDKLQNMGFDTGSDNRSATPKVSQRNTITQEQPSTSLVYSEEDVTTALDDIVMQSDKTRVSASSTSDTSHYNNHTGVPNARNIDTKASVYPRDADTTRDSSGKTMSLPNAARYDGLSRYALKKDKPGKISEQRVSPERAVESGGQSGHDSSYTKKGLLGGSFMSGKRERNKTIAFSKEFLRESKPGDDRGLMKPMNSGLKYNPSGLSEQNLASAGKIDIAQLHSNLKLRAFSPPHTSFYSTTSGVDAKREGKSSLDAARKKMQLKKPTEGGNPDVSKEKESVPIKHVRSDIKIMDYTSSPALKLKSPPHSVFKFPQSGGSASQPDETITRRQVRSPVRQSMIPSPVSPTSPIHFDKALSGKPTSGSYNSQLERSVSPPNLTQGLLRHHNVPNPSARKSFGVEDGAYSSTTDRRQGRAKSLSPVQTQEDTYHHTHTPKSARTPGRTNSFRKIDLSAYDSSSKTPVLNNFNKGCKNTEVLSPVETAVNGETLGNEITVVDSSVGGSTVEVESVGMLQSDLPHAMNDVQRVEISELGNNHKFGNTLPADESSNDHLLTQSDHPSAKQTTIPDHTPLSNAVIDKVANGVDSMGSHAGATPSVNIHSSMDRSQMGETVVETSLEQEASLVSSSPSVTEPSAQQGNLTSDADILSNIIKQLSPESETVGQVDAQSDDRSDVSSHTSQVSDRSRASNFSFRLKPYMPAHVIAEESYLEQRKRESLSGTDRLSEMANMEIKEVKRVTPETQRRVVPTKKMEIEKPSLRFQSDPNLDLRRSDSRSPPFLDRFTPENQFRDSEVCMHVYMCANVWYMCFFVYTFICICIICYTHAVPVSNLSSVLYMFLDA